MVPGPVPLTVLGGYLGAGKTTVLNRVLAGGVGHRLAVVVNDFGSLPVDVDLLAADTGTDGIVNLADGCVCCTLGAGLGDALSRLMALDPPPQQVVIEASGVADPPAVAAWARTPGFEPGGVVVCVAADEVRHRAADRYVGREVRRQLQGADVLLVTRRDLVDEAAFERLDEWLAEQSGDAPRLTVDHGRVPVAVVLGLRPASVPDRDASSEHGDYRTWSRHLDGPLVGVDLGDLLEALPAGVVRLKGWVTRSDGGVDRVQVTGRSRTVTIDESGRLSGTTLVAIGPADRFDPAAMDRLLDRR